MDQMLEVLGPNQQLVATARPRLPTQPLQTLNERPKPDVKAVYARDLPVLGRNPNLLSVRRQNLVSEGLVQLVCAATNEQSGMVSNDAFVTEPSVLTNTRSPTPEHVEAVYNSLYGHGLDVNLITENLPSVGGHLEQTSYKQQDFIPDQM